MLDHHVRHVPLIYDLVSPFRHFDSRVLQFSIIFVSSLALALSAQIVVPFYPVPMTMQVFVLLVIGLCFGVRLGGAAVLLYLLEGSLGLPFFAGGKGGIWHIGGPTGGYLIGFFFCVIALSWLISRPAWRGIFGIIAAQIIGVGIIFLLGVGWLSLFVGFERAIMVGLVPFLLGDALKIGLATALYLALKRQSEGGFRRG